jgi:hypothetical protein
MWVTQRAYRHANGEVEGFRASALTRKGSEGRVMRAIQDKCKAIGVPFDPERVIYGHEPLTTAEREQIQADWILQSEGKK